jgi:hypothetical protein
LSPDEEVSDEELKKILGDLIQRASKGMKNDKKRATIRRRS